MIGERLKKVEAWFWGHEHNLVLFKDDQFGVHKGRLVGCSAFEMSSDDDPYTVNFTDVGVQAVRLGKTGPSYNHGYAIVDLGVSSLAYYEIAAWTDRRPATSPTLMKIAEESLTLG